MKSNTNKKQLTYLLTTLNLGSHFCMINRADAHDEADIALVKNMVEQTIRKELMSLES